MDSVRLINSTNKLADARVDLWNPEKMRERNDIVTKSYFAIHRDCQKQYLWDLIHYREQIIQRLNIVNQMANIVPASELPLLQSNFNDLLIAEYYCRSNLNLTFKEMYYYDKNFPTMSQFFLQYQQYKTNPKIFNEIHGQNFIVRDVFQQIDLKLSTRDSNQKWLRFESEKIGGELK